MEVIEIKGEYDSKTYIVYTSVGVVLFDSGAEFDKVKPHLNNKDIVAVFLTHGHFDHIYNAKFYQELGAKLYIHSADEDCLNSDSNLSKYVGKTVQSCNKDFLVSDGEVVLIGDKKVRVIHTPGHTKGSVCYIVGDCMFSGDTLFWHDYGRTDLLGGSQEELTNSISKLIKLDPKIKVYPGHGKNTTIAEEKAYFESLGISEK